MERKIKLGLFFTLVLLAFSLVTPSVVNAQSVDNFQFSNFNAKYYLSKNQEGQSSARVVETFTAEFPNYNQNKGMVRAIPEVYRNHSLNFKFISLTRNGNPEPIYSQYSENNNRIIETGAEEYLKGSQEFTFTYELTNITQEINNTQEFYWNIIGDQFNQPFLNAEVEVHLSPEIKENFTGELKCFAGSRAINVKCTSTYDKESAIANFKIEQELPPQSSLTVAMQFKPGTFPYKDTPWQIFINNYSLFILGAVALLAGVWSMAVLRKNQTPKTKKALIPEYLPPKNMSVMESSGLISMAENTVLPAEILDLAVRHKVRILESDVKQLFGTKKVYTVELLSTEGLLPDENSFLSNMLGALSPGAKYTFSDRDYSTGEKLRNVIRQSQTTLLTSKGLTKPSLVSKLWKQWLIAIMAMVLSFTILSTSTTSSPLAGSIFFAIVSIIASFFALFYASSAKIYTEKGREAQHYLDGLKMYIKLAEADRLKYLQSPSGAERTSVNTDDQTQMIKLYESVLPYAILFHLEKEWTKALEIKYQESSSNPAWYQGSSLTNGLMLGAFVSSFNSSTASSFRAPSSSSGSGISGGFAGGGGGGGGGGGR